MCKRLGFAFLPWTPPRPWRSQCGKLCTRENAALSVTCWCHHITHSVQSPIGFCFCNFTFFFKKILALLFLLCTFLTPAPCPFLDATSSFPTQTKWLSLHLCVGPIYQASGVNKDEHPSQFWRQNGNPHLLYFFCRETLVRAGHTCRRSHINLYERVVS